jgi:hypothetical protein
VQGTVFLRKTALGYINSLYIISKFARLIRQKGREVAFPPISAKKRGNGWSILTMLRREDPNGREVFAMKEPHCMAFTNSEREECLGERREGYPLFAQECRARRFPLMAV